MKELQALVTGALVGTMMGQPHLAVDVEVETDDDGNYLPTFLVVGRNSGERLRVTVDEEPA